MKNQMKGSFREILVPLIVVPCFFCSFRCLQLLKILEKSRSRFGYDGFIIKHQFSNCRLLWRNSRRSRNSSTFPISKLHPVVFFSRYRRVHHAVTSPTRKRRFCTLSISSIKSLLVKWTVLDCVSTVACSATNSTNMVSKSWANHGFINANRMIFVHVVGLIIPLAENTLVPTINTSHQ